MYYFIIFYFIMVSSALYPQTNPPKTVDKVDLKKYAGQWYEIAKIPNSFQDQCVKGTTAEYILKDNGEFSVINSCLDEEGEVDKAEGVARIVDKKSNAKLEVSFVSFLGWRPFWGDYWIIALDKNYQWVIVGTPDRKYGWILSRTKEINRQTLNNLFQLIEEQGYNQLDFELSPQ